MGQQRQPAEVFPGFMLSPLHGRAFTDGRWIEGYAQALPVSPTMNTLYTCPTGKKAVVSQVIVVNYSVSSQQVSVHCVPNAGSPTAQNRFVSGSVAANGHTLYNIGIGMNAGDSIQATAAPTASVLACYVSIWEFPASDPIAFFYQALAFNTVTTLYTAPTGKSAHVAFGVVEGGYGGIIYNDVQSPGAQFRTYIKPSGVAAYQITQVDSIPVSTTYAMDKVMWPTLGPGDAWQAWTNASQFSSTSGGMNLWGIVCELDAA